MNDRNEPTLNDPALALDVLMGRIVDGEANEEHRRHFESLAAADADLWRRLALRQQDAAMLSAHVEPVLNKAEAVQLPAPAEATAVPAIPISRSRPTIASETGAARWPWWIAASGWAAMIPLAMVWGATVLTEHNRIQNSGPGTLRTDARHSNITPEEHLQQYMQAPFVMGDMPPTLLQFDQLSDGRYAVSYLRRIVEVKYYDSANQIPLDADGNLTNSPRELRPAAATEPGPSIPRN